MKRYTVTDNERLTTNSYHSWEWNCAWLLVFIIGFLCGATIF